MAEFSADRSSADLDLELAEVVREFGGARVLVIGDIILDRYVSGTAHRLSPEAPIPVLRPTCNRVTLGGAANVALNIATLGGHAALVGVIGEDAAGAEVSTLVNSIDRITPALVSVSGRPTTTKTRFMVGSHQILRLDEEMTTPLPAVAAGVLLALVEREMKHANIIILSDYAKGVLCDGVLDAILLRTCATGKIVIADPKRSDFKAYRGATILTPNESEARTATHIDVNEDAEADRAGRAALEATGGEAVLVTRSAKGLTLVSRNAPTLHVPASAREVADVSGAGDTLAHPIHCAIV